VAALEIIRLLLDAGADPSTTNKSGKKPKDFVTDTTIKGRCSRRTPFDRPNPSLTFSVVGIASTK
jgi:hypothetical protein